MPAKNENWKKKAYDLFCLASLALTALSILAVSIHGVAAAVSGGSSKPSQNLVNKNSQNQEENSTPSYKASLAFTGDILLESGFYSWLPDDYSFGSYLNQIEPYLKADLTIANLETPIGGQELGLSASDYRFNAPYQIAEEISKTPINFVTFANNHTFDKGQKGINNTLENLDKNGIKHTGAYSSLEDSNEISVVDVNGIKVAILAYTYGTNQAMETKYGVNHFLNQRTWQLSEGYKTDISNQIAEAKKLSDFVIVAVHWGKEFTYAHSNSQEQFAQFLIDQSVDLIIGNHPHNIQDAAVMDNPAGGKTYIFYSMGNFISAAANVTRATDTFTNMYEIGTIGRMNLVMDPVTKKVTVKNPEIIPFVNHFEDGYTNFQIIPFSKYTDELAAQHMQSKYSSNFNTSFLKDQIQSVLGDSGMLNLSSSSASASKSR